MLYTVKVSGAEMKAYMEWAAECWNQWVPGDVTISFNPNKAGYLHDHFIGLNYEVNLSKPAGERIENVTFKGEPLTDDMELTLCVNDYRFTGLKTAGIISGEKEWESSASVRDMLVAYLAEHDPLDPVVDHNWSITGVDLQEDSQARADFIAKVNAGELATPYYKSYNVDAANNVLVDGVYFDADCVVSGDGDDAVSYYRLRDIAYALKRTDAAFNVEWTSGQVVVTKGGEYTAEPLTGRGEVTPLNLTDLTVLVDGAPVQVAAVSSGGNYYLSAESLAALLGITASVSDGVLTIATH